jgi:hypothetical protein
VTFWQSRADRVDPHPSPAMAGGSNLSLRRVRELWACFPSPFGVVDYAGNHSEEDRGGRSLKELSLEIEMCYAAGGMDG